MITIVGTWINHPEVLKIHRDLWVNAFLGENVRYVAYIDAKDHGDFSNFNDTSVKEQLIRVCEENAIEYLIVPQDCHKKRTNVFTNCQLESDQSPSGRNALVCQYAWNTEVLERGVKRFALVQSDIFPYRKFTWANISRSTDFYYKPQVRNENGKSITYAWEGLCLFNVDSWSVEMKKAVDFQHGFFNGVYTDTGGGLSKILTMLPDYRKFGWGGQDSGQWTSEGAMPTVPFWVMEHLRNDPRNKIENGVITYYSELQDDRCFHLRAGGNWDNAGKEIHDERYSRFASYLTEAMHDGTVFLD